MAPIRRWSADHDVHGPSERSWDGTPWYAHGTAVGHPVRTFARMLVSFVLRLVPEALRAGVLAGQVEVVATGEHRAVHGFDELIAFCKQAAAEVQGVGE
jgi:hypothetical protein